MKHAANTSRTAVKPKAKTLTQVKAIEKTKPSAKKPTGVIALKSGQLTPAQKTKAAAKSAPKNSPRTAKPAIKENAPKLSAKTLDALKNLSARKAKPIAKQADKPKAKKTTLKTPVKTIKAAAQKTKLISPIKRVKTAAKKLVNSTVAKKSKPTATLAKAQVSVKATVKKPVKAAKSQSSKVAVRTAKPPQPKIKIAVPAVKSRLAKTETAAIKTKTKPAVQKTKPVAAPKKPAHAGKTKLTVAAQSAKPKKFVPTAPAKKVIRQPKKLQPTAPTKKIAAKTESLKPIIAAKKVVKNTVKVKLTTLEKARLKTQKLMPVADRNSKTAKAVSAEKSKPVKNAVEAMLEPPLPPKNRKARPIGSAVFRGVKERYDFKVFALNEKFEPIPAVYIISKRKTDRHKRGHHALICIGETHSIADELKRHRKGKCVKKHEANVVSILPEADAKVRLKIETDLKAAHAVACALD